jgi:hypothetical protein
MQIGRDCNNYGGVTMDFSGKSIPSQAAYGEGGSPSVNLAQCKAACENLACENFGRNERRRGEGQVLPVQGWLHRLKMALRG